MINNFSLFVISLSALIAIYVIAQVSGFIFGIIDDGYYSLFHFAGGVATALFFFSIFPDKAFAVLATFTTAVIWEIHEWALWKYFLKKDKYRPKRNDTIMDIVLGTTAAFLTAAFL